jgi:hypothetical protein
MVSSVETPFVDAVVAMVLGAGLALVADAEAELAEGFWCWSPLSDEVASRRLYGVASFAFDVLPHLKRV